MYRLIVSLAVAILMAHSGQAQTSVTNVKLRTDPVVRKVIIEYELPQVLPDDSIYVELETVSGRILRPLSVQGDVGKSVKAGTKKTVTWDVVRDNIRLNEDVTVLLRVARMVSVASPATAVAATVPPKPVIPPTIPATAPASVPESIIRKKSPLPIIGWAVGGLLTGYATVLALGINKDVDAYNSQPYADNAADLQKFQEQKSSITSRKGTFTIVAGAAAAVVIANVIYTFVRKPAVPGRTSLLIQSTNQLTSIGLSRRF